MARTQVTVGELKGEYGADSVIEALEEAEKNSATNPVAYAKAVLERWRSEGRIGREDYRASDEFWKEDERKYVAKVTAAAKNECRIALCQKCSRGTGCGQEPQRCGSFVAQRGRFLAWPACVSYDGPWHRSREGAIPL